MAIALQDKPNVTAPGGAYPYGDIKDNSGSNDGTPVNRLVYADMHQFFEKLMAEAGVSANGLPDNATNTFQLYQALLNVIRDRVPQRTDISGDLTVNGSVFSASDIYAYEYDDGTIVISFSGTYALDIVKGTLLLSGIPQLLGPTYIINNCFSDAIGMGGTEEGVVLIDNYNGTVEAYTEIDGSRDILSFVLVYKKA